MALSVLAIDCNLEVLDFIKRRCNNQVIVCSESIRAAGVIQRGKKDIDLILIELHMPIMDGYEFLQFLHKEQINIPIIVMSMDNRRPSKMKALKLGACDYWTKPLHEYHFESIWTHVFKDKMQKDTLSMKDEDDDKIRGIGDNSEFGLSMVHSNDNYRNNNVDESENSNLSSTRKTRLVWSPELHDAFVKAIEKLGIENAVPKKILEVMKIPGLERRHVASHLQKYRKQRQQQQQNEMLLVSDNKEPLSAAIPTNFHAEQALEHNNLFPDFSNTVIANNFPPSMEEALDALDDASKYNLLLQGNNMQQSMMHHNQIHSMNFEPSFIMIYGNPASVSHNFNFDVNMNHGFI